MICSLPDVKYWNRFDGWSDFRYYDLPRDEPNKSLTEIINLPARVVNLMCGAVGHVPSDLGVDISEKMLSRNRDIERYLVWDLNDNTKEYPIGDSEFDAAVMVSGIAYLKHPAHTFSEVNRILDTNGQFVIAFGHKYHSDKVSDKWQEVFGDERLAWLQSLFNQTGFGEQTVRVIETPQFAFYPHHKFHIVHARKK